MIAKFKLLILTVLMVSIYFIYANNFSNTSTATETADLLATYNLTSEQIEGWVSEYGKERAEEMIEEHVNEQIAKGTDAIHGLEEWDSTVLEEKNLIEDLIERFRHMWD